MSYNLDLSKVQILSKEEQEQLYHKMKSGDVSARNKLVECCLRMIYDFTSKFCYTYKKFRFFNDLLQDANLHVIEVLDGWDINKGCLTTYVSNSILNGFMNNVNQKYFRGVRIPRYTMNVIDKIESGEISPDTFYTKRRLALNNATTILSGISNNPFDLADKYYVDERFSNHYKENYLDKVNELLSSDFLKPREKEILKLRFVDGLLLKDIAAILKVSKQAIEQQVNKILAKLRTELVEC